METSDPDDFLTLLLLLGHPQVDLKAVTITPGTREQVGLVRQALAWFGREDIKVGAYDPERQKDCVSAWHYSAYPQLKRVEADPDDLGWQVLDRTLHRDVTMIEGAAPKNLGTLLRVMGMRLYDQAPCLGNLFFQGGFAGEGVVPPQYQLEKFRGRVTCPSFNPNGDPEATLRILSHWSYYIDLRFVSKNVCHGVVYDRELHTTFTEALTDSPDRTSLSHRLVHQGMTAYLATHPGGKAFHDPLAAMCAINPYIGEWANVELYREKGEWGSRPSGTSGVRIITNYDHQRFVDTLLGRA